jgi:hypothetical protein
MVLSQSVFEELKVKFGICSSWAIWVEEERKTLKASVYDTSIFDLEYNPDLLNVLSKKFVLAALNFSTDIVLKPNWQVFDNFHSGKTDWKIRHALMGSPLWGCYMTDFLKNFPNLKAKDAKKQMEKVENREKYEKNVRDFENELGILGAENSPLIAFGREVEYFLRKEFPEKKIVYVPHYASPNAYENGKKIDTNNGEDYKREVIKQLVSELNLRAW